MTSPTAPTPPDDGPAGPAPALPSGWWLLPVVAGVAGFALVHPFDAAIARGAVDFMSGSLSGDLRREVTAWQQYGQGTAIAVVALCIWLLDPSRRRRLLDLALAVGLAQIASSAGKMLVGRPRPVFADPGTFLGPFGVYPVRADNPRGWALVHAWERGAADLWSMPSSHTLFAVVLSIFLGTLYPRLRPLVLGLAVLVAAGRVLTGAHWPTDVIVGACAGWLIGRGVVPSYAGVRALDWLWVRLVDRTAPPALPALRRAEAARRT